MDTGTLIRNARKARNLTQKQLGELSGIAEPTIRRYELGKLNPKIETLQRIASALGVHVLDLTGIGKELDKYVYDLKDISFPPDMSSSEKERIMELLAKSDPRTLYDMLSDEEKKEFWTIRNDYNASMGQAVLADVIREIGLPSGGDNITVAETKNILQRVAEIYGDKPVYLIRITSIMDDEGVDMVVEYAKSIFLEHIDRTALPAEPPPPESPENDG